jgi:hypothetical protein
MKSKLCGGYGVHQYITNRIRIRVQNNEDLNFQQCVRVPYRSIHSWRDTVTYLTTLPILFGIFSARLVTVAEIILNFNYRDREKECHTLVI